MRILSVDDKEENLYLLEAMARGAGYEIVSAHNGVEALRELEREEFDLIVSDILMSKMDGYQLCHEVKKREHLKHIPLIFYTSTFTEKKDEEFALKLGAARFVIKPTDPEKFVSIIREVIQEYKEQKPPGPAAPESPEEEAVFLKSYSERVVQKLEKKIEELEVFSRKTQEALEEKQREIAIRQDAEDALRENESRYRFMIEQTGKIVYNWDVLSGRVVWWGAIQQVTGYSQQEMQAKDFKAWEAMVHPEDMAAAVHRLEEARQSNSVYNAEYRLRQKDGNYVFVEDQGVFLPDVDGQLTFMLGTIGEISARKKAEMALRESEERYRAFVTNSSEGIWRFEGTHHLSTSLPEAEQIQQFLENSYLAECNDAMARMYGFEHADQIMGCRLKDLLPPSDPRNMEYMRAFVRSGYRLTNAESYEKDREGKIRCFVNSLVGIVEKGQLIRAWGVQQDITERKQAEQRLRESETRFRRLVDSNMIGIMFWDCRGRILDANDAFLRMIGYSREDLQTIRLNWMALTPPEHAHLDQAAMWEVTEKGVCVPFEKEYIRKDGSRVPILLGAARFEGDVENGVAFIIDLTERRRAEAALRASEARYRITTEQTGKMVYDYDVVSGGITWHGAISQLTGFTTEEFQTFGIDAWTEMIHPEDRPEAIRQLEEAMKACSHYYVEYRFRRKDGSYVFVEDNGVFLPDENGKSIRMLGSMGDISERIRAKTILKRNAVRLDSLVRLNQITGQPVAKLLDFALEEAIHLTESAIGYIFYYNEEKRQFTLFAWSRSVMEQCAMVNKPTIYNLDEIGLLGEPVRQRRPVVTNQYAAPNPLKKGYPTGHVHIERHLSLPVFIDNQIVAVIGVGNKSSDYTEEDVQQLQLFSDGLWNIIQRKQVAEELHQHREALEELVKNRTAAMRESEQRYRVLFENSPDAIIIAEPTTKRLYHINPTAHQLLGYAPHELETLSLSDIHPADAYDDVIARVEDAASGKCCFVNIPCLRKDGSTVYADISGALITIDGKAYILELLRDATQRRQHEEALRASEERYRTLVDNIGIGVAVISPQMEILALNRQMRTWFPNIDPTRRPVCYQSFNLPPRNEICSYCPTCQTFRDGKVHETTITSHIGNGSVYFRIVASPIKDREGKIVAAIEMVDDITERTKAAEQLQKAKEAAETANRAKTVFLANMSHEIRTPLNAVLGFSQLMLDEPDLTADQKQYLNAINRSGEHLLALINEVLEVSKIESGRTVLNPSTFDLSRLLDDVETMFRTRTVEKNLQFLVERVGALPRYVLADESKLRQILINLLGNAVKFTEQGGIALRLRVEREGGDILRLVAEVEDTGPGISEEEKGRLFQYFEQTEHGRRTRGGAGLGLAISREFVRMMGGDISISSELGRGTVFHFEVFLKESEGKAGDKKTQFHRVLKLQPDQPKVRILIVDDAADNRLVLSRMLTGVGFETRQAVNGEEAVREFEAWSPQLIFMDMRMPVLNGYDAIRRIRTLPGGTKVKIVSLTASTFEDKRKEVFDAGADDFLGKPFREAEMFDKIKTLLGVKYIYADETPAESRKAKNDLARENLDALPPELLRALREAVIDADMDQMLELIGRIEPINADVARGLRQLAERFEYERLLLLLPAEN